MGDVETSTATGRAYFHRCGLISRTDQSVLWPEMVPTFDSIYGYLAVLAKKGYCGVQQEISRMTWIEPAYHASTRASLSKVGLSEPATTTALSGSVLGTVPTFRDQYPLTALLYQGQRSRIFAKRLLDFQGQANKPAKRSANPFGEPGLRGEREG